MVPEPTGEENRMQAIEARLRLLEDELAIRKLLSSYGPTVDSGNSDAAAQLYADDGIFDYSTFVDDHMKEQYLDQQGIFDMLEHGQHQTFIHEGAAHTLGPAVIDISGDTAVATNYSVIFRRIGMSITVYRMSANRWDLVRTAKGWRYKKRTTRMLDGSPEARALLAQAVPT
jgi:hypothetical protein